MRNEDDETHDQRGAPHQERRRGAEIFYLPDMRVFFGSNMVTQLFDSSVEGLYGKHRADRQ